MDYECAAALARKVAQDDQDALSELMYLVTPELLRCCSGMATEDAEEVLNDVWMALWQKRRDFNPQYVLPWVYQVFRHKMIDWRKRVTFERKMTMVPLSEVKPGHVVFYDHGFTQLERRDSALALRQAMQALRACDKDLLVQHYWKEMRYAEIAKRHRIPMGTVRSRLFDIRARLAAHVDKEAMCI